MALNPRRRSDPKKLARERELIRKDLERRMAEAPQEVPPKKPSALDRFVGFLNQRIEQREQRRNPPPRKEGAWVTGFKKPRSEA